jgi:hypothetical protein
MERRRSPVRRASSPAFLFLGGMKRERSTVRRELSPTFMFLWGGTYPPRSCSFGEWSAGDQLSEGNYPHVHVPLGNGVREINRPKGTIPTFMFLWGMECGRSTGRRELSPTFMFLWGMERGRSTCPKGIIPQRSCFLWGMERGRSTVRRELSPHSCSFGEWSAGDQLSEGNYPHVHVPLGNGRGRSTVRGELSPTFMFLWGIERGRSTVRRESSPAFPLVWERAVELAASTGRSPS